MENNEQNNEMVKKGAGFIIIISALVVIILGLGGYILYDKVFATKNSTDQVEETKKEEEKKEEKVENLEVTSKEVTDLFDSITHGVTEYCGVDNYFADKKVTTNDIDNGLASSIVLYNLYQSGVKYGEGTTITKKQVEDSITKLFGKNYKYTYGNIRNCPSYTYDVEKEVFTAGPSGCGGTCGPHNMKKVVKATKSDSKIELYVRILFIGEYTNDQKIKYYSDYKKTKEADLEKDKDGIPYETDANYQKGSLYKMTFTKEDNNYVFTSSELVNE